MNLDYKNATTNIISDKNLKRIKQYNSVIVFGAGDSGTWVYMLLEKYGIEVNAYCDNYKAKQGTKKHGLPVLSFEEAVKKYPQAAICIGSVWYEEIYNQIINYDCNLKNNIFSVLTTMVWETGNKAFKSEEINYIKNNHQKLEMIQDLFVDDYSKKTFEGLINYRLTRNLDYLKQIKSLNSIYLDEDFIDIDYLKTSVCIDGGAFDGDTIKYFIDKSETNQLYFHAYEADLMNCNALKKYIASIHGLKVFIHNAALWNKDGELLHFSGGGLSAAIKDAITNDHVKTETIDSLMNVEKRIGYIKLDIEGSENKALNGARKIIKRDKPVLAICAYHLQDDLIELPKLILEINPEYKLYLRHYRLSSSDTIIYAV